MDVGHIILDRPWLYDRDVTIYGRPNSCSFVHDGKVKLAPVRPAPPPETKQTNVSSSKNALTLISPKIIDKEIAKGSIVILVARKVIDDSQEQIPTTVVLILKKFDHIFSEKLMDNLPPMRDI